MVNAVVVSVDTFNASLAGGISSDLTFSFTINEEFEAFVPIEILVSANLSFGAEVHVFRSGDGGNSWETQGDIRSVFPIGSGAADFTERKGIDLTTGQYLIRVVTGSGTAATYSISLNTAQIITAYE